MLLVSMTYSKPLAERLLSICHNDSKDLLTVDLFSVYFLSRFHIAIGYIEVYFSFGLPDFVLYIEEFDTSRFAMYWAVYSIHFTVTLARTRNI